MLVKSVKLSMSETLGKIQKSLIILMFLVYLPSQKAIAQCEALFSYSVDSVGGSVQFTNLSVKANPDSVLNSSWLDTSGNVLSNSTHPLLIFGEGTFEVCLLIENAGCTDSSCQLIRIPPAYCVADFTYAVDLTGKADFVSQSVGRATKHFWSFGDGSYASDSVTTHTFTTNGWYYVCLNTTNTDSTCNDVHCEFVRVNKPSPEPCVAIFDYVYDSLNTKLVHFKNYTTGDTAITYVWLFGDDATSTQKEPSYLFSTLGNYRVCLLVSGPNCADSVCTVVEILQILPTCEAAFDTRMFADSVNQTARIAVFTNLSTGENLSYEWSFGDDSTSTEFAPIHYYPQNGMYTVCLTVSNGALCSDSVCTLIEILPNTGIDQPTETQTLTAYPVPIANQLIVEWQSYQSGECSLLFSDMQGRIVHKQTITQIRGVNSTTFNTETLCSGMYTLTLQSEYGTKKVKIVK
jgi:PKD repeat protein